MNWETFTGNLQATLPHITDRCFLIISTPSRESYVQFAASSNELTAEVAGPEFATGAAAHTPDEPAMRAAGWSVPTPASPNWSRAIPLPALSQEFAILAEQCTTALRDTHHVENPDRLRYQAWREPEQQPAGVTWEPERFDQLDPGENPLQLPMLGLPQTNTPA